jgi:hypothetical protein
MVMRQPREPKPGASCWYTLPSVATLPFFTSLTACSTDAAVRRLAEPALSSAPHSLGAHLSLSGSSLAATAAEP